jgi:tRNA nucleotidyltransferase/poly(A) polymerase
VTADAASAEDLRAGLDEAALHALLARPALRRLLKILNGGGEETRVIGGAVRNALIGRPIADVDLASTATPNVVAARAGAAGFKVVPTGVEHGTVTVIAGGASFEVTTLREDVDTDGRRATVRFGRDFEADAQRRDFTINALSVDADGVVHDAVGGLRDLGARRVVFIGDARARIREDYLRILRLFRFHAEYGEGPLDPPGFAAAIHERAGLAILSRERIRVELLKLLRARRAIEVAAAVSNAGLMQLLTGGVVDIGRLARVARFEREEKVGRDAIRRLAALAVATAEDADRLREFLRLSNAEHERALVFAALLARLRSAVKPVGPIVARRLAAEYGAVAVADTAAALHGEPRPIYTLDGWAVLRRYWEGAEPIPVFPLRGADLVRRGVAKGPKMGRRLAKARRAWLDAGCPLGDAARERLIAAALDDPDGG